MTDTLKSICEQCIHLNNPQLDFIPANLSRHRAIVLRDLGELVTAASAEMEKTVVILAGSLFETVLFAFIASQQAYIVRRRGAFSLDPNNATLENYKNIFNRWFSDALPAAVLPDFIVDYRNLVHVNREIYFPPNVCERASREMLRTLDSLLGELSRFGTPP